MSGQNDAATISADELRRRLDDPGLTIVDVRPLPAYNGWRTGGEARGGHIPEAVAFPCAWLSSVDDAEVERLLHSKDIVPSREVVLYGDDADDVSAVRTRLTDLGHVGVRTYDQGWAEWAADDTLPVRSEEHTSELQSPVHLVSRLLLEKKKHQHRARDARSSYGKERHECARAKQF